MTRFAPGSVSRLAGSAHRWDELYAGAVQRKTTESRTDCSSIGNNLPCCLPCLPACGTRAVCHGNRRALARGRCRKEVCGRCGEHGLHRAGVARGRLLAAVSLLFSLFRVVRYATAQKHRMRSPRNSRLKKRRTWGLRGLRPRGLWAEISLCPFLFPFSRGRFP